jgi:predicted O-methyltransferase YrrM
MHDVSDHQHGTDIDLALLESIRTAPAWLTSSERLLLFSLIYSLRPRRYLEIGILFGGASLIVTKAMDASKSGGRLVLVDPEPQVAPATWAQIAHRSVILEGRSPEVLERAAAEAGEEFDWVFIDAGHSTDAVLRDAAGVMHYLSDGAYVMFHDSFHEPVATAIDRFLRVHGSAFTDFGLMTREFTRSTGDAGFTGDAGSNGSSALYCGFRLLQYRRPRGRRRYAGACRRWVAELERLARRVREGVRRRVRGLHRPGRHR